MREREGVKKKTTFDSAELVNNGCPLGFATMARRNGDLRVAIFFSLSLPYFFEQPQKYQPGQWQNGTGALEPTRREQPMQPRSRVLYVLLGCTGM